MKRAIEKLRYLLSQLLQFPNIDDDDEILRIWIVQWLFVFAFISNSLILFVVPNDRIFTIQVVSAFPLLAFAYAFFQWACRRGYSYWASAILTMVAWGWLVLFAYVQGPFDPNSNFHLIGIAVVLATLLLGTRAGLMSFLCTIMVGFLMLWLEQNYIPPVPRVPAEPAMHVMSFVLAFGLIFALVATAKAQLMQSLSVTRWARRQSEERRHELEVVNENIERQIAERTRELEATLQQQDDLLRIVAHDLKNPLASVALALDMLIRYPDRLSAEQRESRLLKARGSVDDMTQTISRLLEASRIEAGQVAVNREMVPLKSMIATVAEDYEQHAENKGIKLIIRNDEDLLVWADSQLLHQVLANLISNALKYSPRESSIEMKWERQKAKVSISIRDEGQGLTLDDMSKLYRKFTRLSATPTAGENSAGLGLYIVKLFIEAMSGKVKAESAGRDRGSTFTITLPVAEYNEAIIQQVEVPKPIRQKPIRETV